MVSEAVGSNLKAKKGGRECRTIVRGLMRRCWNDQRNTFSNPGVVLRQLFTNCQKNWGCSLGTPASTHCPLTKKRQYNYYADRSSWSS